MTLDRATVKLFEALPDRSRYDPRGIIWTPQRDELLKTYWPRKVQGEVAKALGVTVKVARGRYREITGD